MFLGFHSFIVSTSGLELRSDSGEATGVSRSIHQSLPFFVSLLDNLLGIGTGLGLSIEGEVVLRLASDGFVVTEPNIGVVQQVGHFLLQVFNVVDVLGEGVG